MVLSTYTYETIGIVRTLSETLTTETINDDNTDVSEVDALNRVEDISEESDTGTNEQQLMKPPVIISKLNLTGKTAMYLKNT